ncbi:MAG TPA: hemerythrin domain-containing protein [Myxococcales bacterium]|jgi:hemerythrin superfamily protein
MDALTLLAQDHKAVDRLFKRFEATDEDDSKLRRELVDRMIAELSRHAAIEEALFYPAVREAVPDEEDQVLESLEEHHIVKWTLDELRNLAPDAERFEAKVTVLMENVRHHVQEEESEVFPKLRKALGPVRLRQLGDRLTRAKKLAPTLPHPRSPDSPPANLVTLPIAAAVDRGRDFIKKVSPRKASKKVRETIAGLAAQRKKATSTGKERRPPR